MGPSTGSTVALFMRALGERERDGLRITGVATSEATAPLRPTAEAALGL